MRGAPRFRSESDDLSAETWDDVGFDIQPATEQTARHASASAEDYGLMSEHGYSGYVEGSASRDDVTKTFHWDFSHTTEYRECTEVDQITNGGVTDVQITVHGDRFFYDDLTAENAVLRFDAIAQADDLGDADGEITLAELDAVHLVDVPAGSYGTGSYSDVDTLGDYVVALTSTLGHFQGEGHCHSRRQ